MKYMLLIYANEKEWANLRDSERQQIIGEYTQLTQQLRSSGQWLAGAPLQPTPSAKSVQVRDGKPLITDGPFAETREQLGGYYLIEAKSFDEALGVARRIPGARYGTIEIRPVLEVPAHATA
jgi:hypothetical protein